MKDDDKVVKLYHNGAWYKAYGDSAYIISFLMNYRLFENTRTSIPTVGFPDYSIDKVEMMLSYNKINYILVNDNKSKDFKDENNFEKFLHHDLPFSYVTTHGIIKRRISGSFKVKYEGEEVEEYILGENIKQDSELAKKVIAANEGDCILVNDYKVLIIEKRINVE